MPVRLIVGLLGGDEDLLRRARQLLTRRWGEVDLSSPTIPFTFTDYYEVEMGPDLLRQFVSFPSLIPPEQIAEIKVETNQIEERIAEDCLALEIARPVNIDPGYIDLGKLVLATTKDGSHRVHIASGIYAESTLAFRGGQWQAWPWTYPDYQEASYHAFFTQVRDHLKAQRSSAADGPAGDSE
jgi:hypothetical protein